MIHLTRVGVGLLLGTVSMIATGCGDDDGTPSGSGQPGSPNDLNTREELHEIRYNAAGFPVLCVITDYTTLWEGTAGFFRLLELDEAADEVRVHTYSATYDTFLLGELDHFTWRLNWASRFEGALDPALITAVLW